MSSSPEISIHESRALTRFEPDDLESLVRHLNNREIYQNTLRIPHPYTVEEGRKWLAFLQEEEQRLGDVTRFAIRDQGQSLPRSWIGFVP